MHKKKGTTKNQKNEKLTPVKGNAFTGKTSIVIAVERKTEDMTIIFFQGWGEISNVNCFNLSVTIALTVAITNSTVEDYNHSSTVITFTTVANNFFAVDMHLCTIMW